MFRAEVLERGPNTRFVVTSRAEPAEAACDWFVDRVEVEGWIIEASRLIFSHSRLHAEAVLSAGRAAIALPRPLAKLPGPVPASTYMRTAQECPRNGRPLG